MQTRPIQPGTAESQVGSRIRRSRRIAIGILCLLICGAVVGPLQSQTVAKRQARDKQEQLEKFLSSIDEVRSKFSSDLEEIAKYCDRHKLALEAGEIRKLAKPLAANIIQGKNLPREVQVPIAKSLPDVERKWREDLRKVQTEYAQQLFEKAKRARDRGRISLAYDLVREVARQDPDHRFARRLLGYVRYQNEWVTFFAKQKLESKFVLTEKFGWLKADHVERYENGERFYKNEWMSAEKEAQLRRDFKDAWEIRTDHFEIHTNHSLEMGVELGNYLEDFYRIFFQTFADFLTSKDDLAALFKEANTSTGTVMRPHRVHYYRTQQEYVDVLKRLVDTPIEGTTGLYLSGDPRQEGRSISHFFHSLEIAKEDQLATMFHEATHQLFSEAYGGKGDVGVNSDFWAIEGVACYMESFKTDGERFSLGNPEYIRFQNAQYRYVVNGHYVPLQQLCQMGQKNFFAVPHKVLSMNYSQGAGLAHFFMNYEDGIYRQHFISYLSDIYSKIPKVRMKPRSLEFFTEQTFGKLDEQYRAYITGLNTNQNLPANAGGQ